MTNMFLFGCVLCNSMFWSFFFARLKPSRLKLSLSRFCFVCALLCARRRQMERNRKWVLGGQLARGSLVYHHEGAATSSIGALREAQQVRRFEDQLSSRKLFPRSHWRRFLYQFLGIWACKFQHQTFVSRSGSRGSPCQSHQTPANSRDVWREGRHVSCHPGSPLEGRVPSTGMTCK